jgi:hypothetical protein
MLLSTVRALDALTRYSLLGHPKSTTFTTALRYLGRGAQRELHRLRHAHVSTFSSASRTDLSSSIAVTLSAYRSTARPLAGPSGIPRSRGRPAAAPLDVRTVFTHEFGHSINFAHSQTNGAIQQYADSKGPLSLEPYPTNLSHRRTVGP